MSAEVVVDALVAISSVVCAWATWASADESNSRVKKQLDASQIPNIPYVRESTNESGVVCCLGARVFCLGAHVNGIVKVV